MMLLPGCDQAVVAACHHMSRDSHNQLSSDYSNIRYPILIPAVSERMPMLLCRQGVQEEEQWQRGHLHGRLWIGDGWPADV